MISKIFLSNFRNYNSRSFEFNSTITIIFGNNGVGKTNILESISLFRKGRGLRSIDLDDMVKHDAIDSKFTIYGELKNHDEIANCATSFDKSNSKRIFQVNGNKSSSIKNFPAIIWLTPKMDSIFTDSKSNRRKFLDKIVADIDQNHLSRINEYDKCLRERMILLQQNKDKKWLEVLERRIAERGVAIAIARNEAIEYLNKAIKLNESEFIKTQIKIIGEIEELAKTSKSLEVEEIFANKLKDNRDLDLQSGRNLFGIHRSDFTATLLDKELDANFCSTGEQKSILIAITIARVRINSFFNLPKAILLLDEIVSHLDSIKREELFKELQKLDVQIFATGTNRDIFSNLDNLSSETISFLEISQ